MNKNKVKQSLYSGEGKINLFFLKQELQINVCFITVVKCKKNLKRKSRLLNESLIQHCNNHNVIVENMADWECQVWYARFGRLEVRDA